MTVVLGESADFVKSNEIFSPLVCKATMVGSPTNKAHVKQM